MSRSSRARILTVGPPSLQAELEQFLPGRSQHARTLFEAMGEISDSRAGSPIAAAIVSELALRHASGDAVDALRRLDPALYLVVQRDRDQPLLDHEQIEPGVIARFDAVLSGPIRGDTLAQLLGRTGDWRAGVRGGPSGAQQESRDEQHAPKLIEHDEPASVPFGHVHDAATEDAIELEDVQVMRASDAVSGVVEQDEASSADDELELRPSADEIAALLGDDEHDADDRDDRNDGRHGDAFAVGESSETASLITSMVDAAPLTECPRPVAPSDAHSAPADASPQHGMDAPLGDTDLIRAILEDRGTFTATALRLIAQQTGWNDVQWHDARNDGRDASDVNPAAASESARAAVHSGGETFGSLTSAAASREELAPWAEWLATWMQLHHRFRCHERDAMHDQLTGACNRRYFDKYVREMIDLSQRRRLPITIMVFDIDDFKSYNDRFGHAAGDDILIETVRLLQSVIRRSDRVCRIGGDEFAVIFCDPEGPRITGSSPPETVSVIARRFQEQVRQMRFPKLGVDAPGQLTISAGLAAFPWDGSDPDTLLRLADERALQSKRAGKNAITFGPHA